MVNKIHLNTFPKINNYEKHLNNNTNHSNNSKPNFFNRNFKK